MAVAIRLRRVGAKNKPFFNIVATDSRKPVVGVFIEKLGYYNPQKDPAEFQMDKTRMDYWISVGAKPSRTVKQLMEKFNKDEPKV